MSTSQQGRLFSKTVRCTLSDATCVCYNFMISGEKYRISRLHRPSIGKHAIKSARFPNRLTRRATVPIALHLAHQVLVVPQQAGLIAPQDPSRALSGPLQLVLAPLYDPAAAHWQSAAPHPLSLLHLHSVNHSGSSLSCHILARVSSLAEAPTLPKPNFSGAA